MTVKKLFTTKISTLFIFKINDFFHKEFDIFELNI